MRHIFSFCYLTLFDEKRDEDEKHVRLIANEENKIFKITLTLKAMEDFFEFLNTLPD